MQALRLLMLLVVLILAYLMFLRPGTKSDDVPGATPARAHSQYKESMDRAHAAAKQMQASHADADSL